MGHQHSKPTSTPPTQSCASSSYHYCATQGEWCSIPPGIKAGYIAYGSSGAFIFNPFTISKQDGGRFLCANLNGGNFGPNQYCCYLISETQFDDVGYSLIVADAQLIEYYDSFGLVSIKSCDSTDDVCSYYVYNNTWIELSTQDSYYVSFNDSIISTIDDISSLNTWTVCGNGGYQCTGLQPSVLYWIRFGSYGMYRYQMIGSTSNGQIACNSDVFGYIVDCSYDSDADNYVTCDNLPDSDFFCWTSEAQYLFSNPVGHWNLLQECLGCTSMKHSYMTGVTGLTEQQISTSWSYTIMEQFSAGFSFSVEDVGVNLGYTIQQSLSYQVTDTIKMSFSHTLQETETQICDKGAFYQWNMDINQFDGFSEKNVGVQANYFSCIDYGLTPKCPPTYCKQNTNCQNCTINLIPGMFNSNVMVYTQHKMETNIYIFGFVVIIFLILSIFCCKTIRRQRRNVKIMKVSISNSKESIISYGTM